jgi:hypothetical protein
VRGTYRTCLGGSKRGRSRCPTHRQRHGGGQAMAIGENHINVRRSRREGKEHRWKVFRVIGKPVRFGLCRRTSEARSVDAIQRLILCVRRTMIQVVLLPAHRLSPDLPRPGHGGNFTLSGSECSIPQHEER